MSESRPLVERLLDDQALRWGRGERPMVEDYLLAQPQLAANDDGLLDLVNHEVLLREARGETVTLDEYVHRFPRLAEPLRGMFEVHAVLEEEGARPQSAVVEKAPLTVAGATLKGTTPVRVSASALPQVPGYNMIEELGRGGMGVVYLAWQSWPNRMVALKMIRAEAAADPRELARFRTEAEAVARLEHPNIVRLYEVGTHDGRPFFSLEYIQGGNLGEALRGEPLPPRTAAALLEVLARAVHYAHQRGVVHRDLKPANVLIANCGLRIADSKTSANPQSAIRSPQSQESAIPMITDFGLARLVAEGAGPTLTGDVFGTPSYMAPEQADGRNKDVGPSIDIYALGAILYEVLTGNPPFSGVSAMDTLVQVKFVDPVPPGRIQPGLPRDLETICLKCLHKDPRKRYASAEDLADDLRRYLDGKPVLARPVGALQRGLKWARRRPAVATLLAFSAAILLFGFPLVSWQWYQTQLAWQAEHQQRLAADEAREAERQESLKKEAAQRSEADERKRFQALSASLVADEGLRLCDEGDVGRGLFALVHALQVAPPEARDLRRAIRTNLSAAEKRVHPLQALLSHDGLILAVAWSRNGTTIATGGHDRKARVWDAVTGQCRRVFEHEQSVRCLALSADGRLLLTCTVEKGARLWNTLDGEAIDSGGLAKEDGVTAAAFSPDGKTLLTGTRLGVVRLWDSTGGQLLRTFDGPTGTVRVVAFNASGATILAAGEDPAAFLWDTTGKLLGRLKHYGMDRKIGDAAFSPDGKLVLTGSYDGTARLWNSATAGPHTVLDPATSSPRPVVLSHPGAIAAVTFSPDSKRVVIAGANQSARVWTVSGQPRGQPMQHEGGITSIAFSPDGKTILSGGWDQTARLWDAASGEPLDALLPHQSRVMRVAFLGDGRTLLTFSQDRSVRLWGMMDRRAEPLRHKKWVSAVAFSPDGRTALTASSDTTVRLWDAITGEERGEPLEHPHYVLAAAFSPDGRTIVTGCEDRRARIWDVATGKCLKEKLVHPDRVRAVAVSPDGKRLLTGCENGHIYLWDLNTGERLPRVEKHHDKAVYAVAFSPDGRTFLTGSEDMTARVWDATACRPIGPPMVHLGTVRAVAYSRDGQIVLTGSEDRTARLWRAATGEAMGAPLVHLGSVLAVAFGAEDSFVLTGCQDKRARLWDWASGRPAGLAFRHPRPVRAVAFRPDGKVVLTGCEDSRARFWPVPEPVTEEVGRLALRASVLVGMQRDAKCGVRALDAAAWELRRRQVKEKD
jgi:WD40 repeat protein/predicted Ser/Thr protein kinase